MPITFTIPGTTAPEITVQRRSLWLPKVSVDGVVIRAVRTRRGPSYAIPMPDGTVADVVITGVRAGLEARIGNDRVPLERRLGRGEAALIFLPSIGGGRRRAACAACQGFNGGCHARRRARRVHDGACDHGCGHIAQSPSDQPPDQRQRHPWHVRVDGCSGMG